MSTSSSRGHPWEWVLIGMLTAVALAAVLITGLTRTPWGRERILALTVGAVGGRLNGELTIGRLEGELLSGAKLYDLRISQGGAPLLVADSAYVDYDLPTLLGGDLVIEHLVLFDPELYLRRPPGDTLWNYQRLLSPSQDSTPGRAIFLQQARLVNAHVVVRMGWEPDEELTGRARERAVVEALADTSRLMVARVPGGLLRTMEFRFADARLSEGVIAPDERGGRSFRVDQLSGVARVYRDPLRIAAAEGEFALRDGILRFRADPVALPNSRLSARGVVDLTGEEPRYDVLLDGERLAFDDVRSVYPYLPDQGTAQLQLALETLPDGLLLRGRQLELDAPGTTLTGDFGLVTGDTLRFFDTQLRAPRLRIPVVEKLFPTPFPVEGLRIGEAEIRTPSP